MPKQADAFIKTDLFGGSGAVTVMPLLQKPAGSFTTVLNCVLAPGGSVGRHRQEHDEELVLCLGGQGEATVDGQSIPLSPGQSAHLPLGSWLTLTNHDQDAPLHYLIIKVRER